jgi:hypothetical protein
VVPPPGPDLRPQGRGQDEDVLQLRPLPRVHPPRHGRALAHVRAGLLRRPVRSGVLDRRPGPSHRDHQPVRDGQPRRRRRAPPQRRQRSRRGGRRDHGQHPGPPQPHPPRHQARLCRRAPRRVRATAARQPSVLRPIPQPPAQADRGGRGGRDAGGRLLLRHHLLHRQRQLADGRGSQPARVHLQSRRSASRGLRSRPGRRPLDGAGQHHGARASRPRAPTASPRAVPDRTACPTASPT